MHAEQSNNTSSLSEKYFKDIEPSNQTQSTRLSHCVQLIGMGLIETTDDTTGSIKIKLPFPKRWRVGAHLSQARVAVRFCKFFFNGMTVIEFGAVDHVDLGPMLS